ncbi:hypothetical protein BN946_scf184801.g41 [Trametes cinnabarina]|uniref:AB hydrolase-1 domain-containing protein n=1 Tax=Pycnoporus cinnabarinus TaxID=5643 RepID=A0A060SEP6_PYCCI|nr:hypothetical protein BN946_scf184801.g41 [Trametes cinnabarina]
MPTGPVDDEGTALYYEDSGAPAESTDYVTVVLIHGTCFHSAVYRPMVPFAAEHNLRFVLLNLRGYPGSTEYSPFDLDMLRGPSREMQEQAMAERGLELAEFLRWYIETANIPQVLQTPGGLQTGGISVLSWSGGNWHTVSMFANAGKVAEDTHEQVSIFALDVSAYYPPYEILDSIDPPPTFDPPRRPLHAIGGEVDPKYAPTVTKMTAETLRDLTHPPIMQEYQHLLWAVHPDVMNTYLHRALYDCRFNDGTGTLNKIWPDLRVHVIFCDMTLGQCAWAATVIRAGHQKANPEHRRTLEVHTLKDANHFVHWEEPERFVRFLKPIA